MNGQLFDSFRLTLDEFCEISQSRYWCLDSKGKYRDVIDAFRTVCWFNGLRLRLPRELRTIGAIERYLEPEAYAVSEVGVAYHRNKWRGYKQGRHTPLESLINKVDKRCAGARFEFSHVLWDILRLQLPIDQFIDSWLQRLGPTVQPTLWVTKSGRGVATRTRRRQLNRRAFEFLEREANLDSLACLTLLLREAHARGDTQYAFEIGRWLCRMFIMTSSSLSAYGVLNPLFDFYERFITPLGVHDGHYYSYRGVDFLTLVGRFSNALYHIKNVDPSQLMYEEKQRYRQEILGWRYGWDYFVLFNPRKSPMP